MAANSTSPHATSITARVRSHRRPGRTARARTVPRSVAARAPRAYAVRMNDYTWFERGHVAIVTGASKGLGRAIAGELARAGISLGHRRARRRRARARPSASSSQLVPVVAIAGDVADGAHVHALVEAAERRFGRIDLVVNNASSIGRSPLPALDQLSPVDVRPHLHDQRVRAAAPDPARAAGDAPQRRRHDRQRQLRRRRRSVRGLGRLRFGEGRARAHVARARGRARTAAASA